MWFTLEKIKRLPKQFDGIGSTLLSFTPGAKYELVLIDEELKAERYIIGCLFSAGLWGLLFFLIASLALYVRTGDEVGSVVMSLVTGLMIMIVIYGYHTIFPSMYTKRIGEEIDDQLIFVLKDMMVQLNSGIPVYNVIRNLSESKYKHLNRYFQHVIHKTNEGYTLNSALSGLATKTKSFYLKKVVWGLMIGLTSGSDIVSIIRRIHDLLVAKRISTINAYSGELQFISLAYLILGAVLPSLGITLLFLFSVFKLVDVTEFLVMSFVIASFICQIIIIGYIYIKRPRGL
jgi:pilus assembly protein TadC